MSRILLAQSAVDAFADARIWVILAGVFVIGVVALLLLRREVYPRLSLAAVGRKNGELREPGVEGRTAEWEHACRQAEALNQELLNSFTASIAVLDRNGRITMVNEAWRRFTSENSSGLVSDFVGDDYLAICARAAERDHDAIASRVLVGVREVIQRSRSSFEIEYPCHAPDQRRWFQLHVYPLSARANAAMLVHVDITQCREGRAKLELVRNLVDQSNDTIEVIDPETARFLDVNAKGPLELGCTREEYLSMRVFDIDRSFPKEAWSQIVDRMRTAGFVSGEGSHRRMDGSTFPIEFNAKLVRLDREYIVAVIRDITERKRAEQRVHQQAAMLDMARDAIIVRGFADHIITFWNKGAERLYGWPVEEAVGRDVGELIYADCRNREQVDEELLEREEWRGEARHRARDGSEIIVSTRATLVRNSQGAPQSVLVINTDISDQKELEARFLRAQRMESIGTLASGIAHDLNNILCPILMTAPLLHRDLPAEVRTKIITNIVASAGRGSGIVKQVLTFGRGLQGERRPVAISAIVKDSFKMLLETFPKDIVIESTLPPDLWLVVGDATQLQQVVINLCLNARDALPEGGELRVSARNLELGESDARLFPGATPGSNVLLEVYDNGLGIPPELQERIFDPFFTTKPPGQGTGLGLATVLGIVKSHGGHIGVTSETGKGTTFLIHLPATTEAFDGGGASELLSAPPMGCGDGVLVVDDEEKVRESARLVLEAHGYSVLVAGDGVEALAVFSQRRASIRVVLTDLTMPQMDGAALINAIREIDSAVPIIASTGMETNEYLNELEHVSIHGLLIKPYGAVELLHLIAEALRAPGGAPSREPL